MDSERIAYELGYQFAEFLEQKIAATQRSDTAQLKRTIYRRHPNGDVEVIEIIMQSGR
ncbi:hypothetical protein [Arthrobacter sp. KNU40]|uniref:hypothetical protein n=1 Tax=Arthrobacter sp. KNU40 TaxID=3447965 RepID=UPI003F647099